MLDLLLNTESKLESSSSNGTFFFLLYSISIRLNIRAGGSLRSDCHTPCGYRDTLLLLSFFTFCSLWMQPFGPFLSPCHCDLPFAWFYSHMSAYSGEVAEDIGFCVIFLSLWHLFIRKYGSSNCHF